MTQKGFDLLELRLPTIAHALHLTYAVLAFQKFAYADIDLVDLISRSLISILMEQAIDVIPLRASVHI